MLFMGFANHRLYISYIDLYDHYQQRIGPEPNDVSLPNISRYITSVTFIRIDNPIKKGTYIHA